LLSALRRGVAAVEIVDALSAIDRKDAFEAVLGDGDGGTVRSERGERGDLGDSRAGGERA
jgi:hypothetical protein